jgi:glucosyl-3-phosphoglycerate synthase
MADFHQAGIFTTLHSLYHVVDIDEYRYKLEARLEEFSEHTATALLLPSLYAEIENPIVINRILEAIKDIRYIHHVVVALGGAQEEGQFKRAREFFGRLKTPRRDCKIVWVEGPRIQSLMSEMEERQIPTGVKGKGQSVWITMGYLFARRDADVIALHDCDIVTYDRILLGRLIEPTANPNNEFEFTKGYYARISPTEHTMKGRVTRLFVTPFVEGMRRLMRERGLHELQDFFGYHHAFKYPLAGEFSLTRRLASGINIAYDWGLEVSTLSEVYQRVIPRKIAQIDLTPNYEHKHQDLSPDDAKRGLHRMVVDISKFYLNYLRSHGVPLDDAFVDMLCHTYYENALKFIKSYSDDAELNSLVYDRYEEELTARYFRDFLRTSWEVIKVESDSTLIPSWNRVVFGFPDVFRKLIEAVEADNA